MLFFAMKKILVLFIALCVAFAGCKEQVKEEFDSHAYFMSNPSCLQKIVNAENNKAPLAVQEYNKIRNNVVKIELLCGLLKQSILGKNNMSI